jgi:glucose dehydrogenase
MASRDSPTEVIPLHIAATSATQSVHLSRRRLLHCLSAATLAGLALPLLPGSSLAQDTLPMATPRALGPAVPPELAEYAADWPAPQQSLAAHRVAVSTIAGDSVANLVEAWRVPLTEAGAYGTVTAIPLIAGEVIYLQDMASNVLAIDRTTGEIIWSHDYHSFSAGPNGVALGYGRVYGALGAVAETFALDAATGDEIWRTRLSANPAEFIFMQPTVYDNVVYIATSPSAYIGGTRGILFALSADSGDVLWQWDTTTDNLWGQARVNAGGGVWYPPSVDDAGNIYFGIGNPAPWPELAIAPDAGTRPGPNLYTSSMASLDPRTGALRWYVQAKPHDQIDHDFQLTPVLATVEVDGQQRTLAIGSGKAGLVIAADAETGEEIWRVPVGEHNAYGDGQELPFPSATPVTVLPGPYGGVQSPLAFQDGLLFVPVVNLPFTYTDTVTELDLATAQGAMLALDARDGAVVWQTEVSTFFAGGATVANDLVFGAGLDGLVRAFAIATGEEVWQWQAPVGINAPLVIAGDLLLVPAGGPFFPPTETPPGQGALIALRLGGGIAATPVG